MLIKSDPGKALKIQYARIAFFALTSICLLCSSNVRAQGDLFINPKRIIFEGQKHFQEINLANIGTDTARYIISFIQIRMKDNGNFEQIDKPDSGQNFASKFLRIFPRTVTLAPKESQVVKIQVNQNNKLIDGEYRSHLYFRAVPKEIPLGESTAKDSSNKGVSVKLTPVYGISIPVIIRIGENNTKVILSDLKFEKEKDNEPFLKFRFNRTGNMSVYGDITIQYISDAGKITSAGFIKGVSVYTPNKFRDIKISLDNKTLNYVSGKLLVTYTNSNDGKSEKLASAELKLN
jgi:P pilus assembly chaperone PapD